VTPRGAGASGALVCIPSTDVDALVAALAAEGVVTSSRDDKLRVSAHCYNTAEDVRACWTSRSEPPLLASQASLGAADGVPRVVSIFERQPWRRGHAASRRGDERHVSCM
jgi:hypothetical protein